MVQHISSALTAVVIQVNQQKEKYITDNGRYVCHPNYSDKMNVFPSRVHTLDSSPYQSIQP